MSAVRSPSCSPRWVDSSFWVLSASDDEDGGFAASESSNRTQRAWRAEQLVMSVTLVRLDASTDGSRNG